MKKLNKILAVASAVMLSTCTGGVKTQAKVVLKGKTIPVKLRYSSNLSSLDEIFQDMQTLENYVDEQRKKIPLEFQISVTRNCLVLGCLGSSIQNDGETDKEKFKKQIIKAAKEGEIGDCLFWAKYLNHLLNKAKIESDVSQKKKNQSGGSLITSYVLHIRSGRSDGTVSAEGHAIVIYKLNNSKETTGDEEITSMPWMVLTCGANPYWRKTPALTLIQYVKDYLNHSKGDFLQLKAETECDPWQEREIQLSAANINKLTEPMMCVCVKHLLTPPGEETILSRVLKLHAAGKNQKK